MVGLYLNGKVASMWCFMILKKSMLRTAKHFSSFNVNHLTERSMMTDLRSKY